MKQCQHCQTELQSTRAKNCPICTEIKAKANRSGTYGFVMEAFAMAKADGLTGAEVHAVARSAHEAGEKNRAQWANEYRAEKKHKAEQKRADEKAWRESHLSSMDEEQLADYAATTFNPMPTAEHETFG